MPPLIDNVLLVLIVVVITADEGTDDDKILELFVLLLIILLLLLLIVVGACFPDSWPSWPRSLMRASSNPLTKFCSSCVTCGMERRNAISGYIQKTKDLIGIELELPI